MGVLMAQLGVLLALLTLPTFSVRTVDVSGAHLLSRDSVLAAAAVPTSSVFVVDGEAIRDRLGALPWVRTVAVTTRLPATVNIQVTEWQPKLLMRSQNGDWFVASSGATLRTTASTTAMAHGLPLLLDERPSPARPLVDGMAQLLTDAAQRWGSVFASSVDAFEWSPTGVLSVWSSAGWRAVFGIVDNADALATMPTQLEVLSALRSKLTFDHPTFGYVDLENPMTPAVGGKPGEPAALRAALAGGPLPGAATERPSPPVRVPTPAASPSPAASPTPVPSPTPLVFTIPRPSPHS